MNEELATMTIRFPAGYPWRHLVIEGEEEVNVDLPGADTTLPLADPKAVDGNQGESAAQR